MTRTYVALGVALVVALSLAVAPSSAADLKLKVTAQADGTFVPVSAALAKGAAAEGAIFRLHREGKKDANVFGQVVTGPNGPVLHWVMPQASARQAVIWIATPVATAPAKTFAVKDTPGKHMDVLFDGRVVTRYMYESDISTPAKAHETYKVYNHVFDAEGAEPITKGAGGLFTHHRGIFIGYSRTVAGKDRMDLWHMKPAHARHEHRKFITQIAGPAMARTTMEIHWTNKDRKPVMTEQRQITVYAQPGPAIMLMDFTSTFTAGETDVTLGGDPEHAGCQYRPHDDVKKNKGELATKYLFYKQSIKGKGQFEKDMPWACMSYSLKGKRYNVQHMAHPTVPKGNVYSAYRPYGRFGSFCATKVPAGKTLTLRYRYYVGVGNLPDRAAPAARYAAFATPPKVEIVK